MKLTKSSDCCKWISWSPRESMKPVFHVHDNHREIVLDISSNHDANMFGKWIYQLDGLEGAGTYRFSVEYLPEYIENETSCIYAMLSWMSSDGEVLVRDYIDNIELAECGWKSLYKVLDISYNVASVQVELALKWTENGKVSWRNCIFSETKPIEHRSVKVAATFLKPRKSTKENLEAMMRTIDEAGQEKPDVICFSETYYDSCIEPDATERIETVPGGITQLFSEKARQYGMYIILSMKERDKERLYNTSVLFGRNGEIVGKYRKTHLSLAESESGLLPGNDYPVFQTDFGRIGILICWDHYFPEAARILRYKGAEIIFVPTIGYAKIQSLARAVDNGIYLVVSGLHGPEPSRIISPFGVILGELTQECEGFLIREIDLDMRPYEHWYSVGDADGDLRSIHMKERRPETYRLLAE